MQVFMRLWSLSFLDYTYALLVCQQVSFPISCGGISLISIVLIASMAYLGSWAFVTPIISAKFLSNHCLFLLKAIGVNSFGPLAF
jgi:hypothetical protein